MESSLKKHQSGRCPTASMSRKPGFKNRVYFPFHLGKHERPAIYQKQQNRLFCFFQCIQKFQLYIRDSNVKPTCSFTAHITCLSKTKDDHICLSCCFDSPIDSSRNLFVDPASFFRQTGIAFFLKSL